MAFITFNGGASVEIRCLLLGQKVENRLHFHHSGDPGQEALDALTQGVHDWWQAWIRPVMSINLELQQVFGKGLTAQQDVTSEATLGPDTAGDSIVASIASHVSYPVTLKTGYTGRSAKGRISYCGLPQDMVLGNIVNAGLRDDLRAATLLLTGVGTIAPNWQFGIASYRSNNADREEAQFLAVNAIGANRSHVGSQNSRKVNVGD